MLVALFTKELLKAVLCTQNYSIIALSWVLTNKAECIGIYTLLTRQEWDYIIFITAFKISLLYIVQNDSPKVST